ncbi:helix-turn-helix domain-containing protein [Compostimonas suwonensis]|uniref:Helix-turn-helix protein n=1 Tax=Compostimonas suwonensis TaxID=1048394 RepID=A0A2M9BCJ4_9MICO|nr:helix-turn-helix domain-containing protein [Compostimonas suwonensis]PJJ55642.1 helix-turn-helix protein [Compostimonas suwonensis]
MSGFERLRRAGSPESKGQLTPPAEAAADASPGTARPLSIDRLYPRDDLAALVRHYWIPRWTLPDGVVVRQGVLEYPGCNLVVYPHGAALHGVTLGRGEQALSGTGWAFGVLLQPGTARALTGRSTAELTGTVVDASELPRAQEFIGAVRQEASAGDDAAAAAAFESWLESLGLALGEDAALAAGIVQAVEADRDLLRVEQLAERFGLGLRRLQRLLAQEAGVTPKWLIRRFRLQEAAYALAQPDAPALAELAASLGYADQSHFSRDFVSIVGETPRGYADRAR